MTPTISRAANIINLAKLKENYEKTIAELDKELEELRLSPTANADIIAQKELIRNDLATILNEMKRSNDIFIYADLLCNDSCRDSYNKFMDSLKFYDGMTDDERLLVVSEAIKNLDVLNNDIDKEIERLKEEIKNEITLVADGPYAAHQSGHAEYSDRYYELEDRIKRLEELKEILEGKSDILKLEFPLYEYAEYVATDEYKKFIEEYKNLETYEMPEEDLSNKSKYDVLADYEKNNFHSIIRLSDGYELDVEDFSLYATEEEKNLYHYLVQNVGQAEADKFLVSIVDNINRSKGLQLFLNSDQYALLEASMYESGVYKDYVDFSLMIDVPLTSWYIACKKHVKGFLNNFNHDRHKSADDYADDYFNEFIKYNDYGGILQAEAIVGEGAGNLSMIYLEIALTRNISLGLNVPNELLYAYGAFGGAVGIGLSSMGNAKARALQELGLTEPEAMLYGFVIGFSESSLQFFMGRIPYLSNEYGMELTDIASEMFEEGSQVWIESITASIFTGEEIDFETVSIGSVQASLMGALIDVGANGAHQIIEVKINGKTYNVNTEDIVKNLDEDTINNAFKKDATWEDLAPLLGEDLTTALENGSEAYQSSPLHYKSLEEDVIPETLKYDKAYTDMLENDIDSAAKILSDLHNTDIEFEKSQIQKYNKAKDEIVNKLYENGYRSVEIDFILKYSDNDVLNDFMNGELDSKKLDQLIEKVTKEYVEYRDLMYGMVDMKMFNLKTDLENVVNQKQRLRGFNTVKEEYYSTLQDLAENYYGHEIDSIMAEKGISREEATKIKVEELVNDIMNNEWDTIRFPDSEFNDVKMIAEKYLLYSAYTQEFGNGVNFDELGEYKGIAYKNNENGDSELYLEFYVDGKGKVYIKLDDVLTNERNGISSETINSYYNAKETLINKIGEQAFYDTYEAFDLDLEFLAEKYNSKDPSLSKEEYLKLLNDYKNGRNSFESKLKSLNYSDSDILLISKDDNLLRDSTLKAKKDEQLLDYLYDKAFDSNNELGLTEDESYNIKLNNKERYLDHEINRTDTDMIHRYDLYNFREESTLITYTENGEFVFEYKGLEIYIPSETEFGLRAWDTTNMLVEVNEENPSLSGNFKYVVFSEKTYEELNPNNAAYGVALYSAGGNPGVLTVYPASIYLDAVEVKPFLVHESLHITDGYYCDYSNSSEYKNAVKADGNYTSDYGEWKVKNFEGTYDQYCEDFAEAGRYLKQYGRKSFEANFPNRAAFFKKNMPDFYNEFNE